MAKRWYFTFKTFQGHDCRVEIYDSDYSGNAIELNKDVSGSPACPADKPLIIEEDNSDDVLENVRIKTGYINLVELAPNAMDAIRPLRNDSLEVYATLDCPSQYDCNSEDASPYLIFHGYIQAQSFDNDFVPYRNVMKIPIQSCMGVIQEAQIVNGSSDIITIFNENFASWYRWLVFPSMQYTKDDPPTAYFNILDLNISQDVLYPYNGSYDYGIPSNGVTPPVYSPITHREFVKMLCDGLGLICHDVGDSIVFTKIGFTGQYKKYDLSDGTTSSGVVIGSGSTVNGLSQFTFASEDNKTSSVMPVKKITKRWTEYLNPYKLDLSVSSYVNNLGGYTMLAYHGWQITSSIWTTDQSSSINGMRVIGYNDDNGEILQLVSAADDLFVAHFRTPYGFLTGLHIELKDYEAAYNRSLVVAVYSGGKWYNFQQGDEGYEDEQWISRKSTTTLTFTNNGTCDLTIGTNGISCSVYFMGGSEAYTCKYQFKNIEVEYKPYQNRYRRKPISESEEVLLLNSEAYAEVEVDDNLRRYTQGGYDSATFEHLAISQRNIKLSLRKATTVSNMDLLFGKFQLLQGDQNNRVISIGHNVREDIYELQVMGNQYF